MTTQDKLMEWPKELMLRDAKVYDDLGGLGQRIFTTAGVGEKVKYVRADLVQSHDAETAQAQPPAARVTDEMVMRLKRALPLFCADVTMADARAALEAALAAQENPNEV